jgi:hypothetical protein
MAHHTLTPQVFRQDEDASRLGFPSLTLAALQKLRGSALYEVKPPQLHFLIAMSRSRSAGNAGSL